MEILSLQTEAYAAILGQTFLPRPTGRVSFNLLSFHEIFAHKISAQNHSPMRAPSLSCYFWDKLFHRDPRRASPFNLLSFHEIFFAAQRANRLLVHKREISRKQQNLICKKSRTTCLAPLLSRHFFLSLEIFHVVLRIVSVHFAHKYLVN